jgi:hypothetical protein
MLLGHVGVHLVQALRYKPKGRGFDPHWCHWNFSLAQSYRPHYGPGVDLASNRNDYHEYFLGGKGSQFVGLTTLPPAHANCLEMWEPQPPGTHRACTGIALHLTNMVLTVL